MSDLKKIVCVEDDEDIRSIIQLALADLGGFEITLYSSGLEALEHIDPSQSQLVMLDVMMPGIDGVETLKRLRARADMQDTPVIFMTAKAQPSEVQQYTDAGAIGVIRKPFDPISLADEVNNLWHQAA